MDGLPIYSADVDGERVDFLALSTDSTANDVLEMDYVRESVELRQTDPDGYELVWDMIRALRERGPVMEAIKG